MDQEMLLDTTKLVCEQPLSFDLEPASKEHVLPSEKSPKRVHFAYSVQISDSPSPLDLLMDNNQELSNLWYSDNDLAHFKRLYKEDSRLLRATPHFVHNAVYRCCSMAFDDQTRGMETYACSERVRRRVLTVRFVCKTQREVSRRRLATLSQRYTRWAERLAVEEAYWDYERAYGAHTRWKSTTNGQADNVVDQGLGKPLNTSCNRDILGEITTPNEDPNRNNKLDTATTS